MKFHSPAAAIETLQNTAQPEGDRIAAIHYLAERPTAAHIDVLALVLGDDVFGVRWAASNALRYAGQAAFRPVLRILVSQGTDALVREAACHALCDNVDSHVRAASQELIQAMKGAGADVATPQMAFQLLRSETFE